MPSISAISTFNFTSAAVTFDSNIILWGNIFTQLYTASKNFNSSLLKATALFVLLWYQCFALSVLVVMLTLLPWKKTAYYKRIGFQLYALLCAVPAFLIGISMYSIIDNYRTYQLFDNWLTVLIVNFVLFIAILILAIVIVVFESYYYYRVFNDISVRNISQIAAMLFATVFAVIAATVMLVLYFVFGRQVTNAMSIIAASFSILHTSSTVMLLTFFSFHIKHEEVRSVKRSMRVRDEQLLALLHDQQQSQQVQLTSVISDVKVFEIKMINLSQFSEIGSSSSGIILKALLNEKQLVAVKLYKPHIFDTRMKLFKQEGISCFFVVVFGER